MKSYFLVLLFFFSACNLLPDSLRELSELEQRGQRYPYFQVKVVGFEGTWSRAEKLKIFSALDTIRVLVSTPEFRNAVLNSPAISENVNDYIGVVEPTPPTVKNYDNKRLYELLKNHKTGIIFKKDTPGGGIPSVGERPIYAGAALGSFNAYFKSPLDPLNIGNYGIIFDTDIINIAVADNKDIVAEILHSSMMNMGFSEVGDVPLAIWNIINKVEADGGIWTAFEANDIYTRERAIFSPYYAELYANLL